MDNLGDWLYIVLLVIAGISGLLSAGKKKQREQPREILGQPEYEFDPEYSEQEEVHEEIFLPPKPAKAEQKKKTPETTHTYIPLFREGERMLTTPDLFSEASTDNRNPSISGDTFQDMDELKKAIIYSEILHRKYS